MPCSSPWLLSCTPPCLQDMGWGLGAPAPKGRILVAAHTLPALQA